MTTEIHTDSDKSILKAFWPMLREYNETAAGSSNYEEVCVLLRDDAGEVAGGLNGATYRGWMFVENLVVRKDLRRHGLGSRLLTEAEEEARRRGCIGVYLDTYDFQARPFYEKQGYAVFGTLDDFPPGHSRYFMSKRL